ncbi:MAG: hypothetical protein IIB57_13370, partial [Planctomycetes bacterium]|nr:hypothetical protein [Planctomycetota bacterium]
MTEPSRLGRREFLVGTTGLLTASVLPGTSGRGLSSAESAEQFIVKSQPLPGSKVKLPTDRLPLPT